MEIFLTLFLTTFEIAENTVNFKDYKVWFLVVLVGTLKMTVCCDFQRSCENFPAPNIIQILGNDILQGAKKAPPPKKKEGANI